METSDSEYYESADEDIQSDEEVLKKPHQRGSEEVAPAYPKVEKIIDNEVSKEPIETRSTQQTTRNDEGNSDLDPISSKLKHIEISDDSENIPIKDPTSTGEGENTKIIQSSKDLANPSEKKSRSSNKTKLGSKLGDKALDFAKIPEKKIETRLNENESGDCKVVTKNQQHLTDEENLWGDEELDWGLEGKLEAEASEKKEVREPNREFTQSVPKVVKTEERTENKQNQDSWASWGSWGASVLSTATSSVSSITSQLTNVIETGLGAVDPEELAKINVNDQRRISEMLKDKVEQENLEESNGASSSGFRLENLVKLVEDTGTKVISGGLDTLETIGKKTMEVLQEGDPGLKKKRAFLKLDQDKPVLSKILREAKDNADREAAISKTNSTKKVKNYEILFDDHHGLVHLEALELLSKQCDIKLKNVQNSLSGDQYTEFVETMTQVKELCELPDEEDEEQLSVSEIKNRLQNSISEINVKISYEKLLTHWEETEVWLNCLNMDICDAMELHQQAIDTLAQITSLAMEQFHKVGELLLIKERRSTADEADSLVQITISLICLIGILAAKLSEKLNVKNSPTTNQQVSELITNVFFEAANSSSYIQDAFQLLIPVLQVGAL